MEDGKEGVTTMTEDLIVVTGGYCPKCGIQYPEGSGGYNGADRMVYTLPAIIPKKWLQESHSCFVCGFSKVLILHTPAPSNAVRSGPIGLYEGKLPEQGRLLKW